MATNNKHLASAITNNFIDLGAPLTAIEVIQRGTSEVYFTVDGTAATVGGANTYVLPAVVGYVKTIDLSLGDIISGRTDTVVNYIGVAAGTFSIEH